MEYLTDYGKEVIEYYNNEYIDLINIKKLAPALETAVAPYYSSRKRFTTNIQKLKYSFLFKKTNMITTVFIIGRGDQTTNYAYLYSEVDVENPKKYTHKYASLSSTFKSQDGEYRYRFNQLVNIIAAKEQVLGGEAYSLIENMFLAKLESGRINLRAAFYYPKMFIGDDKSFEEDINSSRFAITFLSLLWLADFNDIHNNKMQNHMIMKYREIMYHPAEDDPTYEKVIKVKGAAEVDFFCDVLRKVIPDISLYRRYREKFTSVNYLSTGQKIFPIAQKEVYCINNILYPVWREIYISGLCSNIVANFIAPCFPMTNDWFFIQNINKDIFDNEAQHEKFVNSKVAREISNSLGDVKKLTYIKQTEQPINYKFKKLGEKIASSVSYTENHLVLSDLALCLQMEHAGRTIKDVFQITAAGMQTASKVGAAGLALSHSFAVSGAVGSGLASSEQKEEEKVPAGDGAGPNLGPNEKFRFLTDIRICRKIIFDYIYGFYCLNSRLNIAHGDLHLNNGTIYKLYDFDIDAAVPVLRPKSLYFISADEAYMLDHDGSFGIIIDLSRGVVANRTSLRATFGAAFTESFIKDQNDRILRVLYRYFNEFVIKYKDQLLAKLLDSPDLFFKVFSVIDVFALARNLSTLFEVEREHIGNVIPAAIKTFIEKLATAAEMKLVQGLEKVVKGSITSPDDIDWPNLEILRMFYEEDRADLSGEKYKGRDNNGQGESAMSITICDVFNAAAEMKTDMKNYKTWPSILKFDKEYEILKKYGLTPQAKNFEEWKAFFGYDESNMLNVIKERYRPDKRAADRTKSSTDWLLTDDLF